MVLSLNAITMLLSVLVTFISLTPPYTYNEMWKTSGDEQNEHPQALLELTTDIVNQRYCKNREGGYNTLKMSLRLRYKNISQQPVILYKGNSEVYREVVSLSAQGTMKRPYILDLSLMAGTEKTPEIADGTVPDKHFVILPPGATFETRASTGGVLFLKKQDGENSDDALGTGEYMLQISVSTFPYTQTVAENLRNRWKESGILWSGSLTSTPMPFKVERSRKLADCKL